MTLEEKAEEYAIENDICVCDEEYQSHNDLVKAYLAGAKELEQENLRLKEQIEKMKCCANCKWFKGYGETCEGWGEPVLNLNCDCTEWELKEQQNEKRTGRYLRNSI